MDYYYNKIGIKSHRYLFEFFFNNADVYEKLFLHFVNLGKNQTKQFQKKFSYFLIKRRVNSFHISESFQGFENREIEFLFT